MTWAYRSAPIFVAALTIVSLSGCTNSKFIYSPRNPFSAEQDIKDLSDNFKLSTSIAGYYSGGETKEKRNRFIAGRLALYDLEYIRFVSQFRLNRAEESTIFDGLLLGLTFATTVLSGEETKSILGAGATALAGWRSSYEKNYYEDKTSMTLVTSMNAERKAGLVPLMEGVRRELSEYPFEQALADLDAYRAAGTIDGALYALIKDSAAKDAAATAELKQLRAVSYTPDPNSYRLARWLFPRATLDAKGIPVDAAGKPLAADMITTLIDPTNWSKLQTELSTLALRDVPFLTLFSAASLSAQRARIIQDLNIP